MGTRSLNSILLAALLALSIGFGSVASDSAAAADCTWQRHSKRVVKKVKRQGKVRRVVGHKRWWSCVPLPVQPAPSAPAAAATPPEPTPTPQPTPEEEALPRRVSVKANDDLPEAFSFALSRPFVYAGEVTVELNNSDAQDPHNLNLRTEGDEGAPLEIPEAGPGERRLARFQLPAGSYRLWCSLPQHEEWGMSVGLEVRPG
ncbi:MAG TPA: hypothetical protein VFX85_04030 [Solirubrobacterales bacterium]|nr:hypothetical protein [Solirubrobacterales bacterium]